MFRDDVMYAGNLKERRMEIFLTSYDIAALNLCDYIVYVTNFSCETFGVLIALIYLFNPLF